VLLACIVVAAAVRAISARARHVGGAADKVDELAPFRPEAFQVAVLRCKAR
jgi:hypothetical protein